MADDPCNSETQAAETIAMRIQRKRSRRVSFAEEITSVHFFNRDDESDNPPDSDPHSSSLDDSSAEPERLGSFFKDIGGGESDDFKDSDDDDDDAEARKSFLRPLGSPSPGSSGPGSATSNDDEDNFFGPVSEEFIRPGLSGSAASDDFHETTMDTTAFSLHYRSLARSESGGDLKTPTAFRLSFDEKTPPNDPGGSGSLMSLTKPKNRTPQSPVNVDKTRGGEDSNDMSIIEENPHRYDYASISPRLDALLAEGSKGLHADSVPSPVKSEGVEVAALDENGISHMDLTNGRSTKLGSFGSHDVSTDPASVPRIQPSDTNGHISVDASSERSLHLSAGDAIDGQIQTPKQLIKVSNKLMEDALQNCMESGELPAVNGNVSINVSSKEDNQFDASRLRDTASQHINQSSGKGNSPKDRRDSSNSDHPSDKEGSVFLLSTRGQQSIMVTPNLAIQSGTVTPSSKHSEWYPSIQKSLSRLRIPEPSPRSSLKEGLDKVKSRMSSYSSRNASLLSYSSRNDPLSTVLASISKDLHCDFNNPSTAFLEKQSAIGDVEKGGPKSLVNIDSNGNENLVHTSKLGKGENSTEPAKHEESLHHMVTGNLGNDKLDKPINLESPSHLSASESQTKPHLLMSGSPTKGALVSSGPGSLLETEQENLPNMQVQSENNFQTPLSGVGILTFQLRSPAKKFQAELEPQSKPYVYGSKTEPSLQTAPSCKDSAPNPSMEGPLQSPPREKQTPSPPMRNITRSPLGRESLRSPPREKQTPSPPLRNIPPSPLGRESTQTPSRKDLTQSPANEPIHSLIVKEATGSPLISSYAEHTDNMRMVGKDTISSGFNSTRHHNDNYYQGLHISQSPLTEQDAENSFSRKRRNIGINLQEGDCMDKISDSQRSSKVHKSEKYDSQFMMGCSSKLHNERENFGAELGDTSRKSWTNVLENLTGDSEELLSPSTSNLNLKAIGVLEDILPQLLKAKKYEIFTAEIQSQNPNCISARNKRVAEARLMLYRVVYEKAKLQLMNLRRKKLQSRAHPLSSAIQESQMLKLNFFQCQSETGKRAIYGDESHHQSCLVNHADEQEVSSDNVRAIRQELNALDGEIKGLSTLFHSRMKLKGKPSCVDTISLVHDHLKIRACCSFIRQDLQLWEVDEFEMKNGYYNILLTYHGYINQRFAGKVDPNSHIVISKCLNDVKIMKAFPNMDAPVAFAFVLDGEATKDIADSRCFPQETQVTRSQICNLLDVVEEVQLARFEIVKLIQTKFLPSYADQLDLQLCFLNCKSSRKVMVSLNMTCLKRGVYPSEILPYRIQASESSAQALLTQSLSAQIKAAAEGLESGYMRLLRLCKCISNVV